MSVQDSTRLDDAVLAAWNAHDVDKFLSYCADDIVWQDVTNPQPLRGKEGARKFFEGWLTAFPDLSLSLKNRVANEDQVATEIEFSGTHRGPILGPPGTPPIPSTGKRVNASKGVYFAQIKSGKVIRVHTYPDMAGLMMQLGLVPAPAHATM